MVKTRIRQGLLVVGIAAVLCGLVFAAEHPARRDQDKATQRTPQQRQQATPQDTAAQQAAVLHRTSKLIGKDVKNAQNEDVGSIYDLVLTPDHEQLSYAALSYGGTWGIGAKYFAIPWTAFRVGPQGDIVLPVSKDQFEQASGFDRNNWPAQGDWRLTASPGQGPMPGQRAPTGTPREPADQDRDHPKIDTRPTRPGQTATDRPGAPRPGATDADSDRRTATGPGARTDADTMGTARDIQYRRVTKLTGTSVRNAEGEDIGDIEDFVIDASRGHVAYTIVSFGGFWGIGEKYAAVPASAIQIQPQRSVARLNADRKTLETIAFDPGKFPNLSDRQYAQRLHETFNAEPYWTVYGYASPEQEQAAMERAWGAEGEFARHFDRENIKTVEGTVQSVGSFQPEGATPGVSGGLRIRLTTEEGNLVTVYGGPQWYAQQHDFYIRPGEKISVMGSETKIGWRSVLVASQIKAGDRTLQLRSETGQPLWQTRQQQGQMGQPQGTTRPGAGQQTPPRPGHEGQHPQEQQPNQ